MTEMIFDVACAVNFMHTQNPPIIHRDIKPENILCFGQTLKLADFGSSNLKNNIMKGTLCGTPEYMAPEMILKEGHNEKVDVWGLGILLFELIFGKTPFIGSGEFGRMNHSEIFQNLTHCILVIGSSNIEQKSGVSSSCVTYNKRPNRKVFVQRPRR